MESRAQVFAKIGLVPLAIAEIASIHSLAVVIRCGNNYWEGCGGVLLVGTCVVGRVVALLVVVGRSADI